jgi:peptide deformylase
VLNILQYPDDRLRIKCKSVDKVTPELVNTATEMLAVMRAANGIGLAAPQVGLDMALIVLENGSNPIIAFNPVIMERSKNQEYTGEGCLSFNGVTRIIKRPREIIAKYRDEHGKMQHYVHLTGVTARCFIHEWEHLQGKLFIDLDERQNND